MKPSDVELTRRLAENPRVSLRRLALELGVSYIALRERLRKLVNKGLVGFALMVSPELAGYTAAVVRIRSSAVERIVAKAYKCNRVITGLLVNSNEAILVVYGRDKKDVAFIIEMLRSEVDNFEASIEYGRLPPEFKVQIRNPAPSCTHLNCSSCIPVLRNRVNNSNR